MRVGFFQICGLLAILLLGWDVYDAIQTGDFAFAPLGQRWFQIDQMIGTGSLNLTQAVIQRFISTSLWDYAIQPVLTSGAVLTLIGIALITYIVSYSFRALK